MGTKGEYISDNGSYKKNKEHTTKQQDSDTFLIVFPQRNDYHPPAYTHNIMQELKSEKKHNFISHNTHK